MPHDYNGRPIVVGDVVLVPMRVEQIYEGKDYSNIQVETVRPMYPGNNKMWMWLNGSQVTLPHDWERLDGSGQLLSQARLVEVQRLLVMLTGGVPSESLRLGPIRVAECRKEALEAFAASVLHALGPNGPPRFVRAQTLPVDEESSDE